MSVVAVLLVVGGLLALITGFSAQVEPPPPPPPASAVAPAAIPGRSEPAGAPADPTGPSSPTASAVVPALPGSVPTRLDIPAIGVASDLLQLGLNPDDTVEVPPLSKDSPAGWYQYSVAPGEVGPAVVLGHVDSAEYGPGVFFELGALLPGDSVSVTRADGVTAVFRVDRVASYPKAAFPTDEVYGDTARPELRLITCGGTFDSDSRSYLDNVIVFASFVGPA
ncbi:class F sortase [Modestobacter muralis]|uniref:Class F sortase n=2 Tax=Modestobacter muralis TaxID=1608614 RepID=A0A6P0EY01_9ACTN|nr:class F sortase [Modestobacter muralis]NEN52357.1 class F sortase [Modestobacter muralis]